MTSATAVHREIADLRSKQEELEARRKQHNEERERALAVGERFFRQADVDEPSHALARIERQLANIAERIGALEKQLPSPKAVRQAKVEAGKLLEQAADAGQRFDTGWMRFVTALGAAEEVGREVAAAKCESWVAVASLTDLVNNFALKVDVPSAVGLPAEESKLASGIVALLRDVAYIGEIDSMSERELAAARERPPAA